MILEVVQSKWSLTWYDPLSPQMCVLELMNGHVLQTLREQLKVPGSRLEGSELLTSEFLRFRSRLNETSGGLGKIGAVSGSDCRILKFLRTKFLAAKLLGWKVSVKGIHSSLSEADGSKADSLLMFWTRLSALAPGNFLVSLSNISDMHTSTIHVTLLKLIFRSQFTELISIRSLSKQW